MRSILLLLLGVPIPVIILIALVSHCWYGRWDCAARICSLDGVRLGSAFDFGIISGSYL